VAPQGTWRKPITNIEKGAHGFTTDQLVELGRDGLASGALTRVRAGRETLEIAVLRITAEGRKALAEAMS
jgi:hypothetical protein